MTRALIRVGVISSLSFFVVFLACSEDNGPPAVGSVTLTPDLASQVMSDFPVEWSSADPTIGSVTNGVVTGISPGDARIIAAAGGRSDDATITVKPAVSSIVVEPASVSIVVAETVQLTATVLDENGDTLTDRQVSWESSDVTNATVDDNGLVTAEGTGLAVIFARADGVSGSSNITTTRSFSSVSAGALHSCGVATNGWAHCWGEGDDGRLGNGQVTDQTAPVAVSGMLTFDLSPGSVDAGFAHSCARTAAGSLYCWGSNASGQLGDGSTTSRNVPVVVLNVANFGSVSAGSQHTCGSTTSNAAYCWGSGGSGRLGNNASSDESAPVLVDGSHPFTMAVAAGSHSCGVTTDRDAYCWGQGQFGKLGNDASLDADQPVLVSGTHAFTSISASTSHTCAVTTTGAAYCWGLNNLQQLGDNTTTNRDQPVLVLGSITFASVSAGSRHTCGVTAAGVAYCWGSNASGQLGDGSGLDSGTPVDVAGGLAFASISAGFDHTCGVTASGAVYCWGSNASGQLGNGSTTSATTPTRITGPF
jgi:alpha-tubulin suppressor-like RCC1 family protein